MLINKATITFILLLTTAFSLIHAETKAAPTYQEYIAQANAYAKLKLYDRALTELDSAIKLNPDAARAYKVRGNVYFAQRKYTEALKDFNHLHTLNPSSPDSYMYQSIVNGALGNYKQAIEDINRALSMAPKSKVIKQTRDRIFWQASTATVK